LITVRCAAPDQEWPRLALRVRSPIDDVPAGEVALVPAWEQSESMISEI